MEESTSGKQVVEEKVESIFKAMSEAMDVPVELISAGAENKVKPHFDVNAILSKFTALLVYCGMNVPSSFTPAYNRVHADVDFWKRKFEEQKKPEAN